MKKKSITLPSDHVDSPKSQPWYKTDFSCVLLFLFLFLFVKDLSQKNLSCLDHLTVLSFDEACMDDIT